MKTNRVKKLAVVCALGIVTGLSFARSAAENALTVEQIQNGFVTPPNSAKPQVWWHWMNGHVSREGITKDLESIKAVGIGGMTLFEESNRIPQGPVTYNTPEHFSLIRFAAAECGRLGLEFGFHNCPGWSASGGPWITEEQAMKELSWSEVAVKGNGKVQVLELPRPPQESPAGEVAPHERKSDFYRDIIVIAFPKGAHDDWRLPDWESRAGYRARYNEQPSGATAPTGAAVSAGDVRILTGQIDASGRFSWEVPPGDWIVLRIGYVLTGRLNAAAPSTGEGLECDKLDRGALDFHWDHFVSRVLNESRANGNDALKTVLIDSYEAQAQTWTPRMAEEFKRLRGYDLLPWLPCLTGRVIGDAATTERFLWDYRRTIADLVQENYYRHFAEKCRAAGLKLAVEGYSFKGIFDDFAVSRLADIPMGEFWAGLYKYSQWASKVAASASDLNGGHLVGAEAFTAGFDQAAWRWHPYTLKAQGDYFLSRGITRFFFQASVHQPWADHIKPGMTFGPHGIQMNRHNTWWEQSSPWLLHLSRSQFMLQQGRLVADICFYYGDNVPNSLRAKSHVTGHWRGEPWTMDADMAPDVWFDLPAGHDFHVVNDAVLNEMRVNERGQIEIPGRALYEVLVLPDESRMKESTLRSIASLVEAGATVIGPRPQMSPGLQGGPEADHRVQELATKLWGPIDGRLVTAHAYGKGRMLQGKSVVNALRSRKVVRDFEVMDRGSKLEPRLDYIHRKIDGLDFYFVSNQRNDPASVRVLLRSEKGLRPEIWHPETGAISPAIFWQRQADGRTSVDLNLAPAESVFVVFRAETTNTPGYAQLSHNGKEITSPDVAQVVVKGGGLRLQAYAPGEYALKGNEGSAHQWRVTSLPAEKDLSTGWRVTFPTKQGPLQRELSSLVDWTSMDADAAKFFSGTAVYSREVEIEAEALAKGSLAWLDLGSVAVIAQVTVNGKDFGTWWKPPFKGEISSALKPGKNQIVIRVTNLWGNRLIGDAKLAGVSKRDRDVAFRKTPFTAPPAWVVEGGQFPNPAISTYSIAPHYSGEDALSPSGLFGPVLLRFGRELVR